MRMESKNKYRGRHVERAKTKGGRNEKKAKKKHSEGEDFFLLRKSFRESKVRKVIHT